MKAIQRVRLDPALPIDHKINTYYAKAHDHEYYEFLFTVKGKGVNVINDELQILESRTLLLIRPWDVHFLKQLDSCSAQFEFYNIPVPVDFVKREFSECAALEELVLNSKIPTAVTLSGMTCSLLCARIAQIENMENSSQRTYLYGKLAQEMCACLLENGSWKNQNISGWFSKLIVEVESIHPADLFYEDLLARSNVTAKTLWKSFKKHFDMTPTAYIRKRRVDAAYEMIRETDLSLMEIAMRLNYGTYAQFYRDFTEFHGLSPREVRTRQHIF